MVNIQDRRPQPTSLVDVVYGSPALVHKGVGLHGQHGCYEVLCVVTATGYLDEPIAGATHKHHSTLRGEGRGRAVGRSMYDSEATVTV